LKASLSPRITWSALLLWALGPKSANLRVFSNSGLPNRVPTSIACLFRIKQKILKQNYSIPILISILAFAYLDSGFRTFHSCNLKCRWLYSYRRFSTRNKPIRFFLDERLKLGNFGVKFTGRVLMDCCMSVPNVFQSFVGYDFKGFS